MTAIIDYSVFEEMLTDSIYKNAKSKLLNKIASNPSRYTGLFRPTTPKMKLIQNVTQSHEINFGDFVEELITLYLGVFFENLEKRAKYNNELIVFDQLFIYNNDIYMIEQKMRDDHDSTKKRGQLNNFFKKINYLKEKYPNNKIIAGMWFVDPTIIKNRNYYQTKMNKNKIRNVDMHLFYGNEFTIMLDKISIWDEITNHLIKWKNSEDNKVILNFELDWENTKKELITYVPKNQWLKLISNKEITENIFPILFPTKKYFEILEELKIEF